MNFLSKFALITLFSLSSFSGKVLAYEYRSEAELGYQSALRVSDQEFTVSKLYFQYKGDSNLTGGSIETPFEAKISGSLRSWVDTQFSEPAGTARYTFERNTQNWGGEVEIRSLSLSLSQTLWKLQTGFQEIAWGETFGFQIVDLVNPRDYSDPLILDPSWSRLPVFTLNGQLFLDRLTLQGIFTPVPRNNKFPDALRVPELLQGSKPLSPTRDHPGQPGLPDQNQARTFPFRQLG